MIEVINIESFLIDATLRFRDYRIFFSRLSTSALDVLIHKTCRFFLQINTKNYVTTICAEIDTDSS